MATQQQQHWPGTATHSVSAPQMAAVAQQQQQQAAGISAVAAGGRGQPGLLGHGGITGAAAAAQQGNSAHQAQQQQTVVGAQQGQPQQQQQHQAAQQQGQEDIKTLWVGDLQYWMDENYLWSCFAHTGELQSVKIIRNKVTGYSEGYGFAEFSSHAVALNILHTYNATPMPQCSEHQIFRLNWASFGMNERRQADGPEFSVFVGDLANDVTDALLSQTFRLRYPSVKGAKVVVDNATGRSKGYGFVRFASEDERNRAMQEMNGEYCSSRPMRIGVATPKKAGGGAMGGASGGTVAGQMGYRATQAAQQQQQPQQQQPQASGEEDPSNTTVFVGGLDAAVTEEQLRTVFGQYGELVYVKIPVGKGCGFVQFQHRSHAEEALRMLHGTMIGQQAVRLSWGRNPSKQQQQQQQQQQHYMHQGQQQQQPQQALAWGAGQQQGNFYGAAMVNPYAVQQAGAAGQIYDPQAAAAAAAAAAAGGYAMQAQYGIAQQQQGDPSAAAGYVGYAPAAGAYMDYNAAAAAAAAAGMYALTPAQQMSMSAQQQQHDGYGTGVAASAAAPAAASSAAPAANAAQPNAA